jgi:rod shape-determining protein MreD
VSPLVAARLRIGLLLVVAAIAQSAFGSDLRVFRVAPDLLVLVAICAGLAGGSQAGAWVGFWAGLLADLLVASATPVGLYALTYCLVGGAVGGIKTSLLPEGRLVAIAVALTATAVSVAALVTLGVLLGQHQLVASGRSWLLRVAVIESCWSALLALPVSWLYRRVARGSKGLADAGGASAYREKVLLP